MPRTTTLRRAAATLVTLGALTATAADAGAAQRAGSAGSTAKPPTTQTARIVAVPTNESNSHQKQKCVQWTNRLQSAQGFQLQIDGHASTPQPNPQVEALADAAMDDGCFVIY